MGHVWVTEASELATEIASTEGVGQSRRQASIVHEALIGSTTLCGKYFAPDQGSFTAVHPVLPVVSSGALPA